MRNKYPSAVRFYSALFACAGFVPIVIGGMMRGETGYPLMLIGGAVVAGGFFGFAFGRMADD